MTVSVVAEINAYFHAKKEFSLHLQFLIESPIRLDILIMFPSPARVYRGPNWKSYTFIVCVYSVRSAARQYSGRISISHTHIVAVLQSYQYKRHLETL